MNVVELRSSLGTHNQGSQNLEIALYVDDKPLGEGIFIDLFELAKSCQSAGRLWIFSCGCGQPMCAGIDDPVTVTHFLDKVVWEYTTPISGMEFEELSDEEYEAIRESAKLEFDPIQYQKNISDGIRKIKSMMALGNIRSLSVEGKEFERLLRLETVIFSARQNCPNRRLTGQWIEVDAYNGGRIHVNGIHFVINELDLPNVLVQLYQQWRSLESYAQSKDELPAYEKYLSAGRAFCSELKHYIGNGAVVKFKYHPPKCYNPVAWEITEEIR